MTKQTSPHSRRWWILALAGVAQLMVVLDVTVVNVALPSAQAALHFSNDQRQWIVTAYSLAFGSMLLLGGKLGDLFGRKRTLIGGATGFALASALGGAASSFAVFAGARALQGAAGALLAPAALSLLTTSFTERSERTRALGIYGAIGGSGASIGLLAIVFGLSHAETSSWSNPLTVALLASGAALLALFVWIEARVAEPLLPLRVLTDRTRSASLVSILIASASMFGVFLFLTYYLQQSLGYSPIMSGLAFLPMTVVLIATATTASTTLQPRVAPGMLVALGMAISAAGMLYLTRLGMHASYAADILPSLLALGVGLGLIFPTTFNNGTRGVDSHDAGVASATVNTSQQVGGSIGTALLSTIAASATTAHLASSHGPGLAAQAAVHGYTTAFAWSAAAFAAGAILAPLLYGRAKRAAELSAEPVPAFH